MLCLVFAGHAPEAAAATATATQLTAGNSDHCSSDGQYVCSPSCPCRAMGHLLQHLADVSQQQLEVQRNVQQHLQYITHGAWLVQEQLGAFSASAAAAEAASPRAAQEQGSLTSGSSVAMGIPEGFPSDGTMQPGSPVHMPVDEAPIQRPVLPGPTWAQRWCKKAGKGCEQVGIWAGMFCEGFKMVSVALPLLVAVGGVAVFIFVLVMIVARPF